MSHTPTLFLWDIDGTLITVGGAGERALVHAIKDQFGIDGDLNGIDYAGRTDRMISHMLHDFYKVERTETSQQEFLNSYIHHLENEMKYTRMRVIDGILEVLNAIESREDFHQGLLTGNLAKGGRIKLEHFDLWKYFPFGVFSDLALERNDLAGFALSEAKKATGLDFDPERTYVIGDTPHDIICGQSIGAKTVAISTGRFSVEQLNEYRPDYAFETWTTPDAFFQMIGIA